MTQEAIAVLGAGSWGTAMAIMMARSGHPVTLWGHDPEHIQQLRTDQSNRTFLPGTDFPANLLVTDDLEKTVSSHTFLMLAVPSHAFRETLLKCKPHLQPDTLITWITKGFETNTGLLAHEVVLDTLGDNTPIALISGPSFALEVAEDLPTAVVVASPDINIATHVADTIRASNFLAFPSNNIASAEIGGSMKNILAIAAGISDGLGYGANARAALITLGLNEMVQLGNVYGCSESSFLGLAGVGDLVLTCTDDKSRNRRLGLQLGKGKKVDEAKQTIGQEVEGIHAAREVYAICKKWSLDMPICIQTYRILYEGLSPEVAVRYLLGRAQLAEPQLD
ncbi:MAG: glycerol-3-phosphate dehydrogenase [Cycloclasticus sp.]|nr:glycerol-3-phosphate dehydrogenase [Cycloclasticus sp.]MBG95852.1 glycerol-3-phosphate dehydrogenase [Cycloclasticus sp.]HAI96873.1 glycerol-3-phosphate dehydrogenase [Methylococcaceae bacterium]|tara:strand:+ start:944 stop:1954 length:1011 start_codon:yes stop_codon:yes gene_type:complete